MIHSASLPAPRDEILETRNRLVETVVVCKRDGPCVVRIDGWHGILAKRAAQADRCIREFDERLLRASEIAQGQAEVVAQPQRQLVVGAVPVRRVGDGRTQQGFGVFKLSAAHERFAVWQQAAQRLGVMRTMQREHARVGT